MRHNDREHKKITEIAEECMSLTFKMARSAARRSRNGEVWVLESPRGEKLKLKARGKSLNLIAAI